MSLFCRSSWIPPFSKGSTSLAKEGTSINQSIIRSSSGLVRSFSWYFIRLPSFLYLFIQLVPICMCPCFAGAVEFLLSVRVQLLLQQKEHTINHSLPWARSVLQSVSRSSSFLPSFLPSFIHAFTQLGTKMSLFCRSSWIPPFSKVSTSLTKEGTSINQSFVLASFGLSVIILFVFLPSFLHSSGYQDILVLQEQLNSSFQ